ncbi:MAG: deoxyribonuclease [Phycisphaera sp.]|nr:deoxyribonuclease [Phycisphaera sp.]
MATLNALNEDNKPVDWWFIYKLPHAAKPADGKGKESTGYEYLYLDAESDKPLALSPHTLDQGVGALHHTVNQLRGDRPASLGWVFYNDEIPDTTKNNGRKGHTKGLIVYDTRSDSAVWVLHSTPRYVHPDTPDFPEDEMKYGQTYLCVTLKDVDTARAIATQMIHQQEPQTYGCRVPDGLGSDDPLRMVTGNIDVNDPDDPTSIPFESRGGAKFHAIQKNRHWNDDFWNDLVGPKLDVCIDVETWRRGTLASTKDAGVDHDIADVLYLNLESLGVNYEWHYTKDHAKWGIGEEKDWVCVADINRDTSQEKRGGGTIAFQHKLLWQSLKDVERLKNSPA